MEAHPRTVWGRVGFKEIPLGWHHGFVGVEGREVRSLARFHSNMSYQTLIDGSCEVFYDVIPTTKRKAKPQTPEQIAMRAALKKLREDKAKKAKLDPKWINWGKAILTR